MAGLYFYDMARRKNDMHLPLTFFESFLRHSIQVIVFKCSWGYAVLPGEFDNKFIQNQRRTESIIGGSKIENIELS